MSDSIKPYELHIEVIYHLNDYNHNQLSKTVLKFSTVNEVIQFCDKAGVSFK